MSSNPHAALAAEVRAAQEAFMRVLTERPQWRCRSCGHDIPTPDALEFPAVWAQADPDGRFPSTVRGIAHCGLLDDGKIVADPRWRLALASDVKLEQRP